jgi:ATP-dependent DNA ligase
MRLVSEDFGSANPHKTRTELLEFLKPYRKDALMNHPEKAWAEHANENDEGVKRMPGGQSRWSQGKDLSWEPVRPELIVEVAYDHMQGDRFRHTAQFRRGRTDKKPSDCTYAQRSVHHQAHVVKCRDFVARIT